MTGRDLYILRTNLGLSARDVAPHIRHPRDGRDRARSWLTMVETGALKPPPEVLHAVINAIWVADAEVSRRLARDPECRRRKRYE